MALPSTITGTTLGVEQTVRELFSTSPALPTGAATTASQGQEQIAYFEGSQANFDGTEIELTGLDASGLYRITDDAFQLLTGTGGNTATLGIGAESGVAAGDFDSRREEAQITLGDDVLANNFVSGIIIQADANGKVYIFGVTTGADDSTLHYMVALIKHRAA